MYKIWADMIAFDRCTLSEYADKFYCIYVGRRDCNPHKNAHNEILSRYRANITMSDRMPAVLAQGMGDQMYIAKFSEKGPDGGVFAIRHCLIEKRGLFGL